ncbi:DUF6685 family protein [Ralstonia sp. ASV6]|uniref:DUF6685 family protein n=1 Tax=Ralstonia sp. ASV6 TaxID=2795124 RepID=UPI0018EB9314|nr:DUF6685 family protein [Ralstonia sp. ASV6]
MRQVLTALYDAIREDLGIHPSRLGRLIEQRSDACYQLVKPVQSIAASSVVRWDELGLPPLTDWPRRSRSTLRGWRVAGKHYYESFEFHCPAFDHLASIETTDDWMCDIQDIDGLSSSKSRLTDFATMDALVERNSREMIDEITHAKLTKNLAHSEIRILHRETTSDHFARFAWDGRLFLMNSGGSHHLAAGKYIAARLGVSVPLKATLREYSLEAGSVLSLISQFEMFVLSDEPEFSVAFGEAMRHFKATWLWHHLPRPYQEHARLILLPKSEGRSMKVADILSKAGAVDFVAYLVELAGLA